MGRLLGLDYGTRTVGVAVSDGLGLTAQALETITRTHENKLRKTLQRIEELIAEYGVTLIVLGLPLNMDDSEGPRAAAAREFKKMLERRTHLPVVLEDERLTTVAAEEILIEAGVPRDNRKAVIDKIAASLILESYMERVGTSDPSSADGQDQV